MNISIHEKIKSNSYLGTDIFCNSDYKFCKVRIFDICESDKYVDK